MVIKKRKIKDSECVGYDEYLKNKKRMDMLLYHNWQFIHEKSTLKFATGAILFGLGFITLPIPTGSIFFMAVGASLMASSGVDYLALRETVYWDVITRLKIRRNKK